MKALKMETHPSLQCNVVKIATLLKALYRFSEVPVMIPETFFTKSGEKVLKHMWNHERQ